jgi:hypothetical protein
MLSRIEVEKGVEDVYYMTHHVHKMCISLFHTLLNPHHSPFLQSLRAINASSFVLNRLIVVTPSFILSKFLPFKNWNSTFGQLVIGIYNAS